MLWGIADFRHRFGREPEGMWLAETAVDVASLEALAEAGHPVHHPRPAPGEALAADRREGMGRDARRHRPVARLHAAGSPRAGRSRSSSTTASSRSQVAFERLLDNGERFLDRLLQGFDDGAHARRSSCTSPPTASRTATTTRTATWRWPTCSTGCASDPDVRLTNYGEFLELHPPEWEVEIHENSSWSCATASSAGDSDCGCKMRGDWHQKWRGPLRQAFDQLKDQLDHLFGTRGRECFPDPWAARDAYIDVILDREPRVGPPRSSSSTAIPTSTTAQVRDALRLLEMQRDGMLMYTSCGWFFDEISGLETTQCLHYAARAIAPGAGTSTATSSRSSSRP